MNLGSMWGKLNKDERLLIYDAMTNLLITLDETHIPYNKLIFVDIKQIWVKLFHYSRDQLNKNDRTKTKKLMDKVERWIDESRY